MPGAMLNVQSKVENSNLVELVVQEYGTKCGITPSSKYRVSCYDIGSPGIVDLLESTMSLSNIVPLIINRIKC